MRTLISVIFLLTLSFLVIPEIAYSQNLDSAFPELEPPPITTPTKANDDLYSLATDAQIKEAQRFYNSCKNNKTMRAQKNCKCAAATFLETRIKLGKTASIDDIMQENVNTCLLDDEKSRISDVDSLELEKITEQQMQEAEAVYQLCEANKDLRNATDCECLAAKFLDFRIKRGPMPSQNALLIEITQKYCRNVVETTGIEYERCMRGSGFSYNNIRPKDYCECYAKAWGALFEDYEGRMDEYKKSSIRLKARSYCTKPVAYKNK